MGSSSYILNRVHNPIVNSGLLDNIHDPFDLGKDSDNVAPGPYGYQPRC